jgi:hypothetical protein
LTWNSELSELPSPWKRRASTPYPSPSCPRLSQTTTKLPSAAPATAERACGPVVNSLTCVSPPAGAPPASNKRAITPSASVALAPDQLTTNFPAPAAATCAVF